MVICMSTAILYSRVSTDDQAESGLGLSDQQTRLNAWATMTGTDETISMVDEGQSGKSLDRPAMTKALAMLTNGDASTLVVMKLDRLTRSTRDLGELMERAQQDRWALVILDLGVDTSTASGKLVANVMVSVAQWERETTVERTKAALAAKKSQGHRLGRVPEIPAATRNRIAEDRAIGLSMAKIADRLNAEGVPTARGGKWYGSTIAAVLKSVALDEEMAEIRRAVAA